MEDDDFELKARDFVSRYDVLSFSPCTSPDSECNGTGFVPVALVSGIDRVYRALWFLMEAIEATDDQWHFVPCPHCRPEDRIVKLAREMVKQR